MAGTDAKMGALLEAFAARMGTVISPLAEGLASLQVEVAAIAAQVTVLTEIVQSKGGKLGVVTAGAKTKAASKKPAASETVEVPQNSMLYFRHCSKDPKFRERFMPPDAEEKYGETEKVKKAVKENKTPHAYWSTIAAMVWGSDLTEEQKATIKNLWKAAKTESMAKVEQVEGDEGEEDANVDACAAADDDEHNEPIVG